MISSQTVVAAVCLHPALTFSVTPTPSPPLYHTDAIFLASFIQAQIHLKRTRVLSWLSSASLIELSQTGVCYKAVMFQRTAGIIVLEGQASHLTNIKHNK